MRLVVLLLYLTFSIQSKGQQVHYYQIKPQAATTSIEIKLKQDYVTKAFEFKVEYPAQSERRDALNLVFRAQSHRWRFLEESDRQGVLLFEGGRFDLSPNPTYTPVFGKKVLVETLTYQISISDMQKVTNAPYLEIQIGKINGRVNEKQLNRIKDFLMGLPEGNTK